MNAQRPSFMLLPDFSFVPNGTIHLGTLLLLSPKSKIPDPDLPLNEEDRIDPPKEQIKRHTEQDWKFDTSTQLCYSAGIEADIPIFLPAGGGIAYSIDNERRLSIECEVLQTERFAPSPTYIARALANDFVQDYCRKKWRPSVYLVTGLKVAENGTIWSDSSRSRESNVQAKLDATATGVPIRFGPSVQASNAASRSNGTHIEGPFLLAYQMKRLRLSSKGAVKSADSFTKFALFDDDDAAESETLGNWDIEDVWEETVHDA